MFGPSTSINDPRARITITSPNYTKGDINIVDVLTPEQYAIIQQIHDQYTYEMAERNYDNIPGDYNQYLALLNSLNTINVSNTTMQFMIDMVEKALIGSMNIVTLSDSAMYNELQILLLNTRINEILTDKNTINVVSESSNVSGQFSLEKTSSSPRFTVTIFICMVCLPSGWDSTVKNSCSYKRHSICTRIPPWIPPGPRCRWPPVTRPVIPSMFH